MSRSGDENSKSLWVGATPTPGAILLDVGDADSYQQGDQILIVSRKTTTNFIGM